MSWGPGRSAVTSARTWSARAGTSTSSCAPRAGLLRERGLSVHYLDGRKRTVPVRALTAEQVETAYDLVVIAVKSYGFDAAFRDAAPAMGRRTAVLPLLNGMRHIDTLVERFGADRVYGGVAMVMTRLGGRGELCVYQRGRG